LWGAIAVISLGQALPDRHESTTALALRSSVATKSGAS
jgi:hypothetical protein